ncbi:MAG TPA: hypothetical protein VG816_12565 [Solirubrobacterales bacterium]|nr:hypothetical protein [Solirubrobacterales bacterium]
MVGTYAAVLAVCGASPAIGQAALALCGVRRWSWLSPAVGLALLCAVCWGTARLPGDGVLSAVVVVVLVLLSLGYLWGRVGDAEEALRLGAPVALATLLATALPFVAEGHFGILGTSFNPDMSQHLLATDRLAHGDSSQLLSQGYPLGPHSIVVALNKGLGIGIVQGFSGLMIAVAVIAALAALAAFREQPWWLAISAALVLGLTYMVASYFAQGSFKETMQALFFLAFVLALREASRNSEWRDLPLRFVPAALLAVGSVYTYSFPGLIWLGAAFVVWAILERSLPLRPALFGLGVFGVLVVPEVGRMIDFHSFETFDPNGPGLGNLFGQISPVEGLGIWPSGDFRLSPGDGAVPALGYYAGAAFATILLVYGSILCWRRRERALIAGLAAAALAYAAARLGGTPYTAAKAIEVGAPLTVLVILLPLLRRPVAWLYLVAAAGCSLLALANAPVGPTSYSPALTGLRDDVGEGPTVVLASPELLADEHGAPYIAWELRGGRVCIETPEEAGGSPPPGVRFVVTEGSGGEPPFPHLRRLRISQPYVLWERRSASGRSPCPLIAVRQARQGAPR